MTCFGEQRDDIQSTEYDKCNNPTRAGRESSSTICGAKCQTKKTVVHENLSWHEQGILKEKQFSIKRVERGCADYDSIADQYSLMKKLVYFCREEECLYEYDIESEIGNCIIETTTTPFPTTTTTTEVMPNPIEPVILTLSISVGILAAVLLCMVVFMIFWLPQKLKTLSNLSRQTVIEMPSTTITKERPV